MFGHFPIAESAIIVLVAILSLMGSISDFVAAFGHDFDHYHAIEKRFEALCKHRLRNTVFLWESRVKNSASLEKKLRDRSNEYEDEAANIADVKDLVGGRIILARCVDIRHVERIVKKSFNFISQTQHPRHSQEIVNPETRFRGYDGLHLYVTLQGRSIEQYWNPVIEIQVVTGFMWEYANLHDDVVYKRLHGEPTEELLLSIDILRGVANLGEIGLKMYDKAFCQRDRYPDLRTRVQSVVGEEALGELETQSQSVLQLTTPQHVKDDRGEPDTGRRFEESVLEERAYALLRRQTRNKVAHLEGVAEARQTLLQGMTISSQDNPSRTRHLRMLHHLAVAERKLSLKRGLDAETMMKHLDQADAYMDEVVGLDLLSGLMGAQEQMGIERHIVKGLKANLEFRMGVRNWEDTRRLLSNAVVGIDQALGDLGKVDEGKGEKNTKFAREWICYFSNAS